MLRGLVAAVLVGVVCAVIGTYVVLRGMAFFGDAMSHTILPGIAAGYLVNGGDRGALFWWALATAVLSSLGIGAISRGARLREDTAIGVVFAGMFALGVALISTVRSYSVDLTHFLFGDVLGVSAADLVRMAIFGGAILLTVALLYKEFLVMAFDPVLATTLRLPGRTLDYLQLVLIAVAVVVAIQTVGVALMLAVLVTPAATAALLTRRLHWMMLIAWSGSTSPTTSASPQAPRSCSLAPRSSWSPGRARACSSSSGAARPERLLVSLSPSASTCPILWAHPKR
jgi:manganese/iron transport system permease protein